MDGRPLYQPPAIVEEPQKRELTREQCTQRIKQTTGTEFVYIPPECQQQYQNFKNWQRDEEYCRQRQAQQEQRERDDAERRQQRQAQQEQRNREDAARRQQQRVNQTTQGVQGIIREIRTKRRP